LHAIQAAVALRVPKSGVLLHSDRGSEYTSLDMQLYMQKCGIKRSFSRIGNCWDNAPIESFFRHCKAELRSMQHVPFDLARARIADYIENFYNCERVHSAINYRTPIQCENDWQQT
ncbi:MAG: transposase, partial [Roseiflexaceae bacterium]